MWAVAIMMRVGRKVDTVVSKGKNLNVLGGYK